MSKTQLGTASTLCVIVLSLSLLVAVMGGSKDYVGEHISAQILGQSGKITYWTHSANSTKFTFKLDSLQEIDTDGQRINDKGHVYQTLANQDFTFGPLKTDDEYYDVAAESIKLTAPLEAPGSPSQGNAVLGIEFFFFKESGNFSIGEDDFSVNDKTFKVNIELRGWEWCDACGSKNDQVGSHIVANFSFTHNMSGGSFKSNGEQQFELGSSTQFVLASEIDVDGDFEDAEAKIEVKGNTVAVSIEIPRFEEYAIYDPITYFDVKSQGNWATGASANAVLLLVLSIIAVVFF